MARSRKWRVELVFQGEPKTKSNAYKFYRGKTYIPKDIRDYESNLKKYAKKIMRQLKRRPIKKLVKVKIIYYLGSKRRKDLQNLPKTTLDSFNGVIYKDDSQVQELHIRKRLDRKNPRIHVIVEEVRDCEWERG